MNRRGTF